MTQATFSKGAKLRRLEGNVDAPKAALRQIGALLVASSQQAFRDQEFNQREWPARSPVNVFGILRDLSEGRKPPARRLETRPALRDTGRLASSISFQLVGTEFVEVGTNLAYAAVHQTGGAVESVPITETVQRGLAAWLKKQSDKVKRRMGGFLQPRWVGRTLRGEVPARPFLGLTPSSRRDIREVVGVRVMEAGRR